MLRLLPAAILAFAVTACASTRQTQQQGDTVPEGDEGADTLFVDLAQLQAGETTIIPVMPGNYIVAAVNLAPSARYRIHIEHVVRKTDPLAVPKAANLGPLNKDETTACELLNEATTVLDTVSEESKVAAAVRAVQQHRRACKTGVEAVRADSLLFLTRRATTNAVSLSRGTDLHVTVTRVDQEAEWVAKFETGNRGEWRTSYGFSFVIDPWNRPYYSRSTAVADSFIVTREGNARWMDFVPTLFYSWMPHEGLTRNITTGLTMGLGFDSSRPVVLLGGQLLYNQNIGVSIGGAFHSQQILNGRYEEGSIVRESLGADQLHESRYRISPFISISLRSLTNPFQPPAQPDPGANPPPAANTGSQ
jgi:hypothetical protein